MNPETVKGVNHSKFITNYLEYIYEGLLAFIILLMPSLVSQEKLDGWLYLALACFAIAIPFLTLCLIMIFYKKHNPSEINQDWYKKWKKFHPFSLTVAL